MKSSSYILLLLLLLTNCSNEEMLQEYEKAIPIHFHSHYIEVSTKTNYTAFLVENSPISLFSIQHLENYTVTSWIPELFNNTEGITDANGDILYDNTYYFPVGDQLDFFAVHPLHIICHNRFRLRRHPIHHRHPQRQRHRSIRPHVRLFAESVKEVFRISI